MSERASHEALISQLGSQLAPVRRLWSPGRRTAAWLALVLLLAVALLLQFGSGGMMLRWRHTPDLAWAGLAALLTAGLAGFAAFASAVPGRSGRWAWLLPLPTAFWWLAASGMGCLRQWLSPQPHPGDEGIACLYFIVVVSLPLSALMIWALRRACPLRPNLSAALAGLACAAASTALLEIFHRSDAAFTDLAVHLLAVGLVIGLNSLLAGRLLRPLER